MKTAPENPITTGNRRGGKDLELFLPIPFWTISKWKFDSAVILEGREKG